jgi:endonuclease YncB( thermonuclease family)
MAGTLATVTLADGWNLNRELVKAGLIWWHRHFHRTAA